MRVHLARQGREKLTGTEVACRTDFSVSLLGSVSLSSSHDISVSLCSGLRFSSFCSVLLLLLRASAYALFLLPYHFGWLEPLAACPLPSWHPLVFRSLCSPPYFWDFLDQIAKRNNWVVPAHLYGPKHIVGHCPTRAQSSLDQRSLSDPVRME